MIDFLSEAQQIAPELTALRHAFHMEPELGNHEFNTASRIEAALNGWDIPTRRLLDTAVVGRLEGALPGGSSGKRIGYESSISHARFLRLQKLFPVQKQHRML